MREIHRIREIYTLLKKERLNLEELISGLEKKGIVISVRQLQRDLNELTLSLNEVEQLLSSRNSKRIKFFEIVNKKIYKTTKTIKQFRPSNFYEAINPLEGNTKLNSILDAIANNNSITIDKLLFDFTGDNASFNQKKIRFIPIEILLHRGTSYLGGYNSNKKIIQFYDITQIERFQIDKQSVNHPNLQKTLNIELASRFGISKNIDNEIYAIIIEFPLATGNYIKKHFWHESQSFVEKKGKILMTFHCGINRELIGWLFHWMYNVKIIAPPILLDYYKKAFEETKLIHTSQKPLVYKNIFNKGI